MIDESIGKILGMAMAYGVSALGLFLAYANYRKRTLKAEKVMTTTAWGVLAAVLLTIAGGVVVVAELAKPPAEAAAKVAEAQPEARPEVLRTMDFENPDDADLQAAMSSDAPEGPTSESTPERSRWPLVGMLLPAIIFLSATWITAGLYRHFSAGDASPQGGSSK